MKIYLIDIKSDCNLQKQIKILMIYFSGSYENDIR